MELDFLREEIFEARMTRNSNDVLSLTYTDVCERLYLSLLVLEVLRRYPSFAPVAHGYAKRTVTSTGYKHFQMHGTDLYNLIHFAVGDADAINRLKDPASAQKLRSKTRIPIMRLNGYLHQVSSGFTGSNSELFINLESALHINNSDYKAIRRSLVNFSRATMIDKKRTVTKLLFAIRAKLRNSDLIPHIEKLAGTRELEVPGVQDNEPDISTPDVTATTNKDLMFYRYIVGPKNLVGTKKFLDFSKEGKAIPSPFVKAYFPAIKVLDDIVKAGPGFIGQLRALQKRALMNRK